MIYDSSQLSFDGERAYYDNQMVSPRDQLCIYNNLDATLTHEILGRTSPSMSEAQYLAYQFSRSLLGPAMDMMIRGVRVDLDARSDAIQSLNEDRRAANRAAHEIARTSWGFTGTFSTGSNADLNTFFYDHLSIKPIETINKGERKRTIGKPALERIAELYPVLHELIENILLAKDRQKLLGTLKMGIRRGRFHTSFNMTTETGRWSSSKGVFGEGFNAQNLTQRVRRMFIADPGKILVYADLKNAESICVAFISGDEHYIYVTLNEDIHTYVARLCWPDLPWGNDPTNWRKIAESHKIYGDFDARDLGKRGGHASNYLAQPMTISSHLKIPLFLAESFQGTYFDAFPLIPNWHHEVSYALAEGSMNGAIPSLTTPFGRTRQFFGRPRDMSTLREAVAYIPQSMTADALNLGMLRVWLKYHPEVQLLLQIHDAILVQIPEDRVEALVPEIVETLQVDVPVRGRMMRIPADAEIGYNWQKHAPDNPDGMRKWKPSQPPISRSTNPYITGWSLLEGPSP